MNRLRNDGSSRKCPQKGVKMLSDGQVRIFFIGGNVVHVQDYCSFAPCRVSAQILCHMQ